MSYNILSINPGSTSTKIALYQDEHSVFTLNIDHTSEELRHFKKVNDQFEFRKKLILNALEKAGVDLQSLNAIVGRGGMVKPVESGVYEMNARLHEDLVLGIQGEHASSLGGLLAEAMVADIPGARAFIADPVVVDEMADVARVAGHALFHRKSMFHALNHKAISRLYAKSVDKPYEDLNLVVAHLGGGVTVGAHQCGRVIDVNDGISGSGPFSSNRSGQLPAVDVAKLCFSGEYTLDDIKQMINGKGGVMSLMGTSDMRKVERKAMQENDPKAKLVMDAMAYNVAKEIGAMATVLEGKVDAILLTGGIAYCSYIVDDITRRVSFIAPVKVYPGEDEMGALAMNGLAVLRGAPVKIYT
jgi:butyrate kinase